MRPIRVVTNYVFMQSENASKISRDRQMVLVHPEIGVRTLCRVEVLLAEKPRIIHMALGYVYCPSPRRGTT